MNCFFVAFLPRDTEIVAFQANAQDGSVLGVGLLAAGAGYTHLTVGSVFMLTNGRYIYLGSTEPLESRILLINTRLEQVV